MCCYWLLHQYVAYTVSVTVQSPASQTMNTDYIEDDADYVRKTVKDLKKQFAKQSRKGRRRAPAPKEPDSDDELDYEIRESHVT